VLILRWDVVNSKEVEMYVQQFTVQMKDPAS